MTEDDDPFADFEDPAGEESDPFADLRDERGESGAESESPGEARADDPTNRADRPDDDPFERRRGPDLGGADEASGDDVERDGDGGAGTGGDGEPGVPGTSGGDDGDDPFAALGSGPRPRTESGDEDDPFSAFESVDVGEVDPDEVWESFASADDERFDAGEKVYYEVSKHRFCERCEHFSPPPDATCTLEGTDVVEFVDMETVRLVNCPVVAEQEELGEDVTRLEPE